LEGRRVPMRRVGVEDVIAEDRKELRTDFMDG